MLEPAFIALKKKNIFFFNQNPSVLLVEGSPGEATGGISVFLHVDS